MQAKRAQRAATPESLVLAACLRLCCAHRAVGWARRMNSGATKFTGRGGKPYFVKFGWPGASDIVGQMRDGRFLAVEVKRPGGRPTPEQQAFLALVAGHGGVAVLVDTVDSLARVLDSHA